LQLLYLDHAATTPLRAEVGEAMAPFQAEAFGNPSSAHAWGRRASAALEEARDRAARALGARPAEVFFVRGGTESDNLAVLGRAEAARASGRTPLVAHSAVEHKAVLESAAAAARLGGEALTVPVDSGGALDLGALDEALARSPALVSVMWVNNEVGTVTQMDEVVRRARAHGVAVHSDAVQAVGKVPVRVGEALAPDLLTITGHKIYGPKGTGILYVRSGVTLEPLLFGGGQERGLRPGTQDVAGACGMARALELAVSEREREAPRLLALRELLEARVLGRVDGARVQGGTGRRAPHISNIGVPGVDQDALLAGFDLAGVAVSSGSACSSGATRASHVLRALYGDAADGYATVRFSLGRSTTEHDVERAAALMAELVDRLRSLASSGSERA
jgi:cysteine desulfurase